MMNKSNISTDHTILSHEEMHHHSLCGRRLLSNLTCTDLPYSNS